MKKLFFLMAFSLVSSLSVVSFAQTSTPTSGVSIESIDGRTITSDSPVETTSGFPRFCGTSNYPASSVQVRVDGVVVGNVTTDSSGNWCYTLVNEVSEGSHTFSVTVVSAAVTDQVSFSRVDKLTDTGSEIMIALAISFAIFLTSVGGYYYFKRVK